jgi:hypothetical protein
VLGPHWAAADQLKLYNRLHTYLEAVHGTPLPFDAHHVLGDSYVGASMELAYRATIP